MPRIAITNEWSVELDGPFHRQVEAGDLVLWDGAGRTVYASVYAADTGEIEAAMETMLAECHAEGQPPARRFDRVEPGLVGHAYLVPEGQEGRRCWGLNTWMAAKGSVACLTFYFHGADDLDWALRAWRSVQCGACETRYLS